jgi:hypothetical protein
MNSPAELLSFPQMVDMIFGTFESGTINLKMLHAFLHALMSQLPLDNVRIRLAGDNLDEVRQKMDRRPKADVKISEYWFNRDEPTVNLVRVKRRKAKDVDKMVVVKQLTEGESDEEVELGESGSMEVLLVGDVNEMDSDHLLALDEILNGVQTAKSELEISRNQGSKRPNNTFYSQFTSIFSFIPALDVAGRAFCWPGTISARRRETHRNPRGDRAGNERQIQPIADPAL